MTTPVRVLYVESNEDGTVGGSHQALYDLARSVPRDRIDPSVLFYEANPFVPRLRAEGIRVVMFDGARARERAINGSGSFPRRQGEHVLALVRRYRLLRQERIDLLHLNNGPSVGVDDWLPAALLAGVPCIVNAMGLPVEERSRIRRILSHRFARVVAISHYMATTLYAQGFVPDQVETIPLAVDVDRLAARVTRRRDDTRAELGIPPDAVMVLMVGNMRRWKGQHVLLDALGRLPEAIRERLAVRFAGAVSAHDEGYLSELTAMVARMRLQSVVRFLGPRHDVPDLLTAADVAVHASILPEPFGLVVLEAMALGVPVLAADLGGPPEILDESSGVLFDPANPATLATALAALVTDEKRRARLACGARVRATQFTLARHVGAMVRLYEQVLAGSSR